MLNQSDSSPNELSRLERDLMLAGQVQASFFPRRFRRSQVMSFSPTTSLLLKLEETTSTLSK
jgi:hypothetical protein